MAIRELRGWIAAIKERDRDEAELKWTMGNATRVRPGETFEDLIREKQDRVPEKWRQWAKDNWGWCYSLSAEQWAQIEKENPNGPPLSSRSPRSSEGSTTPGDFAARKPGQRLTC